MQRPGDANGHGVLKEQEEGYRGKRESAGEGAKRDRQGLDHKVHCRPGRVVWVLFWVQWVASGEL